MGCSLILLGLDSCFLCDPKNVPKIPPGHDNRHDDEPLVFLVTRLVRTKRIWTSHPSFTQRIDAPFRSAMRKAMPVTPNDSSTNDNLMSLHQEIQAVNSPKMSTRCVLEKPAWRHGDETLSMLKTRRAMLHDSAGFAWRGKAKKQFIAESPLSHPNVIQMSILGH